MDLSKLSNEELLELAKKENLLSSRKYPDDFINKIICGIRGGYSVILTARNKCKRDKETN